VILGNKSDESLFLRSVSFEELFDNDRGDSNLVHCELSPQLLSSIDGAIAEFQIFMTLGRLHQYSSVVPMMSRFLVDVQ
jgi:hypothetical protein